MPESLAGKDYLQPFYGHPEWGVRSVFNGYLGWFDGNPSSLFRLSPKEEAKRVVKLADHLLAIDKGNAVAMELKAHALTKLARNMVNVTARNYYLTVARELRESVSSD